MRRNKLTLTVAVTVVVLVTWICVELFQRGDQFPQYCTLPDGSLLTVKAAIFGSDLAYLEPATKPWQLSVGQRLPFWLAARLGWNMRTHGFSTVTMPRGAEGLGIFATLDGIKRPSQDLICVEVLDDLGNYFGSARDGGGSLYTNPKTLHYRAMKSWTIPVYPRRARNLIVRFFQQQGKGQAAVPLAEFRIANPRPGPYPAWTPEPWPVTKPDGDMAVTLTDFTTGLSKGEPTRAALENEPAVTHLAFAIHRSGYTNEWYTNEWIRAIEISDATGNHWSIPLGYATKMDQSGRTFDMTFPGNLWQGEAAWKIQAMVASAQSVWPDGTATLYGIPVPPQGPILVQVQESVLPLSLSLNLGSCSIRLQTIEWRLIEPSHPSLSISYAVDALPKGSYITVDKVSDEGGRDVRLESSDVLSPWAGTFRVAAPTNVTRLNCTFALWKDGFVEFTAKPRTLK